MRVTSDDFEPRRDGWFEHRGTWSEVTVGTVVGTKKRSEAFEVLATAHGQQVQHGYTLWFQMKNLVTGEIFPVEPKFKVSPVVILTRDPRDRVTAPVTEPTDTQAILLLIQELGAETMASHDTATGEVVCPDYVGNSHLTGPKKVQRGLREHLKFAHSLDVAERDHWEDDLKELNRVHSLAHTNPEVGAGFPHRHVPELDPEMMG